MILNCTLYELKDSTSDRANAQRNLEGRSHYVESGTLSYHKARIVDTFVICGGFLFALIENVALEPTGKKRGFRFVIFDIMGRVISRVGLDDTEKSRKAARRAMWAAVDGIDPVEATNKAIQAQTEFFASRMEDVKARLAQYKAKQEAR